MGKSIVQTNLLQCPSCEGIFESLPKAFQSHDSSTRPLRDVSERCQKCALSSRRTLQAGKQISGVFQSIRMHCKNRTNGCPKELPSVELAHHEIDCEFRPVRCTWYLQCEQKEISFRSYRNHLETMHQPYIKKIRLNAEYEVSIKLREDRLISFTSVVCDEKNQLYFTRKCSIDLQKDLFMVCVHHVGERSQARKFLYRVRISQGMDSMNAFYEYTTFCAPCIETPNAPDAHSNCLVLHPKKLFLTDDYLSELKYYVTIKRMKESFDS